VAFDFPGVADEQQEAVGPLTVERPPQPAGLGAIPVEVRPTTWPGAALSQRLEQACNGSGSSFTERRSGSSRLAAVASLEAGLSAAEKLPADASSRPRGWHSGPPAEEELEMADLWNRGFLPQGPLLALGQAPRRAAPQQFPCNSRAGSHCCGLDRIRRSSAPSLRRSEKPRRGRTLSSSGEWSNVGRSLASAAVSRAQRCS